MNILSCISLITSMLFVVMLYRRASGCRLDRLNIWSLVVCSLLAWWALCDAFFYSAVSTEAAWLWHHLGAIGWCGFIPVTAYYFLVMSGVENKMKWWLQIVYWLPWAVLLFLCIFFSPTPLASELIQSRSGLGWTFVQNFNSIMPYLFVAMLVIYFGTTFFLLYKNCTLKTSLVDMRLLSKGFICLDMLAITVGFVFIVILPVFSNFLPPLGFIATLLFLFGYRYQLWELDLMHIELTLNPNSILESSPNAMLILDENFTVLFANLEANSLLNTHDLRKTNLMDYLDENSIAYFEKVFSCEKQKCNIDLNLKTDIPVNCSINKVLTKRHKKTIMVVSLSNITSLRKAQKKLEYLANYDELTELPNRRLFSKLMEERIAVCETEKCDFELVFLDVNNFKSINDEFGHSAGDQALKSVALALTSIVKGTDIVSRFAGDEFVFLYTLGDTVRDIKTEINKAIESIDCSSFAKGHTLSVAIGTSRFSETTDTRTLFKLADERMYFEKKRNR